MTRAKNAFDRACDCLERELSANPHCSPRLPTLTILAVRAGVSRVTMQRAVRAYAERGMISVCQRAGIRIRTGTAAPPPEPPAAARSQELAHSLSGDLLDGAFKDAGYLPSVKELCFRYGVVFRTMKDALAELESGGLIRRDPRRYRIIRPQPLSSAGHLLLLVDMNLLARMQWGYMASRTLLFLAQLENLCHDRRLRLVIGSVHDLPALSDTRLRGSIGIIVWASSTGAYEVPRKLARSGKPVVIIDGLGRCETTAESCHDRRVTILRIADIQAGIRLGQHLISLGHRRAGFFTYYGLDQVKEFALRYEGVCRAFDAAGVGRNKVLLYGRSAGSPAKDQPWVPLLRGFLESSRRTLLDMNAPGELVGPLLEKIGESEYQVNAAQSMSRGFSAAFQDRSITAWITVDDVTAVYGLMPFVKEHAVRVPADLSVAAFENTAITARHNLTVADFRLHYSAFRALDILLRAAARRERTSSPAPIVDIEPVVAVRGSTGVAAGLRKNCTRSQPMCQHRG